MNFMPPPLRCLSFVVLSLALTACDTPPTMVDQHFGMAVQRAQAQQGQSTPGAQHALRWHCTPDQPAQNCPTQHLHPRDGMGSGMGMGMGQGEGPRSAQMAHERLSTNPGSDGASALAAVARYQQSFHTPPAPAPVFNIGLGAVSAP